MITLQPFVGLFYPQTLLTYCVQRVHNDRNVGSFLPFPLTVEVMLNVWPLENFIGHKNTIIGRGLDPCTTIVKR